MVLTPPAVSPGHVDEQLALLKKGTAEIVSEDELRERLQRAAAAGRPLRVKLGVDPTAPDIHLGHAVVLRKLRQFQDLGHTAYFIVGDFTGRIGDPSGRNVTRPQLSEEEIQTNALTYREQAFKILHPERTKLLFNNNWLGSLTMAELVHLASSYTVARLLERDDFAQRYGTGQPISVHEFLYPLAQAYDSVHIEADVELGGTDQKFNLVMARDVQRHYGQEPQIAVLMPILEGLDGKERMSKSLGNYIGIAEPPGEMFGKIMSLPDFIMERYFRLCTDVPDQEIDRLTAAMAQGEVNPRDVKLRLGREIVQMYHGAAAAAAAQEEFLRVFSQKELPSDMPVVSLPDPWRAAGRAPILDVLAHGGLVSSRSEGRRMVRQGAVRVDDQVISDEKAEVPVAPGTVVQVGRRRFVRLED